MLCGNAEINQDKFLKSYRKKEDNSHEILGNKKKSLYFIKMHGIEVIITNYSYIKLFNIKLDRYISHVSPRVRPIFYNIKKILKHCLYV